MSWLNFAQQAPRIATFGVARFQHNVAYLGTIRADGSPRVHPITPIVGKRLFVFMEPTSPKAIDLQRDSRYVLHCGVENSNGGEGEFYVRGSAEQVHDTLMRMQATKAAPYNPAEHYILFVLNIEFAFMNVYADGKPVSQRWRISDS